MTIPASFLKFKIDDGLKSGNFISNEAGKYGIKVPVGSYKVTPVFENPSYFAISPTEIQVDFPTISSPKEQDFCFKAIGVHNDLEITFLPIWPSRPGFAARYKIIYKNKGNKAQSGTLNLPFNSVNRNGYIAFKIKTFPTLKAGDTFENEANIYFDYNFPILTNKASSTFKALGTQDFEFSQYFSIYPNPVKDILNINSKNEIEKQSMAVYDILGHLIIAIPMLKMFQKLTLRNYRQEIIF